MESAQKIINDEYIVLFFVKNSILNIYIQEKKRKGREKSEFIPVQMRFKNDFIDYISDFSDLIQQINEGNNIEIKLEKDIKYFQIKIKYIPKNKEFICQRIYIKNVEYYVTKGYNNERINIKPYSSYIECNGKNYYNIDDILELVEKENILNFYIFDYFKYYVPTKNAFLTIENNNILIQKKNILEFHINGRKNNLLSNIKIMNQYYFDELIKIKNKINHYSDFQTNYDLIFLYASPVIANEDYKKHETLLSYYEEIKAIVESMKNTGKKFKCKFECCNEDILKDTLINYKTKILHISAHGYYKGQYYLCLENTKKKGQPYLLSADQLKNYLINANRANLSKLDLVFVSTCFGEGFGKLFAEFGVKNVIYIDQNTEVLDEVSVFFTKIFYKHLCEGYTIKDSYDEAKKLLREDKKIKIKNYDSSCLTHVHLIDLKKEGDTENKGSQDEINCKKRYQDIHEEKSYYCHCRYEKPNYHHKNCTYFKSFKDKIPNTEGRIKEVKKDIYSICCCDLNYEHDEREKIKYEQRDSFYSDISPFKFNEKGNIIINSIIRYNFDKNKWIAIQGRQDLMGRIINSINTDEDFAVFFGEKGLLKLDFTESLCVYLYERKVINNYEIFRIYSELDFTDMKNKINDENQKLKLINQKNVKVIKFDNNNFENNIKYFKEIYQNFCKKENIYKLFFIFIFNWEDENDFKKSLEEKLNNNEEIKLIINQNLFFAGLKEDDYYYLFKKYLKDSNIQLTKTQQKNLLKKEPATPQNIKKICEQLLEGKSIQDMLQIKNFQEFKESRENQQKLTYLLYHLLSNMPSGLPESFLKLIFDDYDNIEDDKFFIESSQENDWAIIKRNKFFYAYFKEIKYLEDCYKNLLKVLKIYTELLKNFIAKNRKKINNKYGNIHYIYNSYNKGDIWKCSHSKKFGEKLGKKNLDSDFNIGKHKQNIINLIYLFINKIDSLISIDKESLDYLEEILLLFPSYFFLKKENLDILQICINFCNQLIEKIEKLDFKGKAQEKDQYLKREKFLKKKLLIYLYSLDESKNEILTEKSIVKDLKEQSNEKDLKEQSNEKYLKEELDFLKLIRNKGIKSEDFQNLEKNISEEKKFYLYYEYAIFYFKKGEYKESMKHLNLAMNMGMFINDIVMNRILIDYCYAFRQEYIKNNIIRISKTEKNELENVQKKENEKNINEEYNNLIKNTKILKGIMKKPRQKYIYFEAFELKKELYNLLEPDIVMLNSNPLKNKSHYIYYPNNQYYILNELKKNIKSYIRIKSCILNKENLNSALNEKGKILIIQSDDFTENGDFILENPKGKSNILRKKDFIQMIQNKKIKYQVIILCFPKSSKLKEDLNNVVDYLITFEKFDSFKDVKLIMKKYNHESIKFLVDFISQIVDNINNNEYNAIFKNARDTFLNSIKDIKNKFQSKDFIISTKRENINNSKIIFQNNIQKKKVFLYGSFPKLKYLNYNDYNSIDYSSEIYELVEYFNHENVKIFNCNNRNIRYYLTISLEAMKFFYRHKTFCELFKFDYNEDNDKILLKSLIWKLKQIKNEDIDESEDEEDEEDIQQKSCFILIYNCYLKDMLEINLYSVLNKSNNSSFILIYSEDNFPDNKFAIKVSSAEKNKEMHLGETFEEMNFDLIEKVSNNDIFFILFDDDKFKLFDEHTIKSALELEYKNIEFEENNMKENIINYKLDIIKNGNLYEYLNAEKPSEGEEFAFQFDEEEVRFIFYKIVRLIAELHYNNVGELRLEPASIYFDEKYNPLIINFGNSRKMQGDQMLIEYIETINEFIPLELYEKKPNYDRSKVDIFSLGVILFILLFRKRPFKIPLTKCDLYMCIKEGREQDFWEGVNLVDDKSPSEEFKNLFIKMVAANPEKRYSIADVINSKWMKKTNKLFNNEDPKKFEYLGKNIYDKFEKLRSNIKSKKEKVVIIEKEKPDISKGKEIKPKQGVDDINKYNIIKIQGLVNPAKFLNKLVNFLKENNDRQILVNELKVIINDKGVQESNNSQIEYSIELYEDINKDEYFLKFDYINGSLSGFYNSIESIRQYFNLIK